jgi:hypothetical protein
MGNYLMDENLVALYQDLLLMEKKKIYEKGFEDTTDQGAFLTEQEIIEKCTAHGINAKEFLSSNLLVKFPKVGYRTTHFDLIYRLIHIRNLERQSPIPLEYRIELNTEPVPDFGRYKFGEILPQMIPNRTVSDIVTAALAQSKYEGLSSHQLPIVKELLLGESGVRTMAIVAPTASGKTLAFFIPIIVKAVERIIQGKKGLCARAHIPNGSYVAFVDGVQFSPKQARMFRQPFLFLKEGLGFRISQAPAIQFEFIENSLRELIRDELKNNLTLTRWIKLKKELYLGHDNSNNIIRNETVFMHFKEWTKLYHSL